MTKKTKFFRVAKAGATTDGRKIKREWIEQMAKHYNTAVYTARISIEHIKGLHPNSEFRNYGDVLALKTEEHNGELYLLAQIQPTAELIEYTKKGQKNFTSIEVAPKFADTGEAYLVGLAVTDNPASLGTEYLEFCAKNQENSLLNKRKEDPQNLFTEALEFNLTFEGVDALKMPSDLAFVQIHHEINELKAENRYLKAEVDKFNELFAKLAQQEAKHYTPTPRATGGIIDNNGYF